MSDGNDSTGSTANGKGDRGKRSIEIARAALRRDEDAASKRERIKTFNQLALALIATFCISVLGLLMLITYGSLSGGNWKEAAAMVVEVLKTIVVPITSTVVGYYIASARQ